MSKFLRVDEGDYKITVQNGGQITLDTGNEEGTVVITGDLTVQGTTTTVETANMTIEDNIIVLNQGETGAGITDTSNSSGIEIDRGSLLNAFMVYDDNLTDSVNGGGLFAFRLSGGSVSGIRTNHISTAGSDLHLINSGTGVITVSGTNNYEDQVTDDDDITNKKYVDDAIDTAFATVFLQQIGDGDASPSSITVNGYHRTQVSTTRFNADGTTSAVTKDLYWQATKTTSSPGTISVSNSNFKPIRLFTAYVHGTEYFTYADDRYNDYVTFTDNVATSETHNKSLLWKARKPSKSVKPDFGDTWDRGDTCSKDLTGCKMRFGFSPINPASGSTTPKANPNTNVELPFGGFPAAKAFS